MPGVSGSYLYLLDTWSTCRAQGRFRIRLTTYSLIEPRGKRPSVSCRNKHFSRPVPLHPTAPLHTVWLDISLTVVFSSCCPGSKYFSLLFSPSARSFFSSPPSNLTLCPHPPYPRLPRIRVCIREITRGRCDERELSVHNYWAPYPHALDPPSAPTRNPWRVPLWALSPPLGQFRALPFFPPTPPSCPPQPDSIAVRPPIPLLPSAVSGILGPRGLPGHALAKYKPVVRHSLLCRLP